MNGFGQQFRQLASGRHFQEVFFLLAPSLFHIDGLAGDKADLIDVQNKINEFADRDAHTGLGRGRNDHSHTDIATEDADPAGNDRLGFAERVLCVAGKIISDGFRSGLTTFSLPSSEVSRLIRAFRLLLTGDKFCAIAGFMRARVAMIDNAVR